MELPVGKNKKWALLSLVHSLNNSTESRPTKGIYSVVLPYVLLSSEGERFTGRLNVTLSEPAWHWEFNDVFVDNIKHIHVTLVPLENDACQDSNKKEEGECIATIMLTDIRKVAIENK